jgi:2-polyprenyl-6-methoxyphenol hydroxylase-like FAD-dependent oxidoreductase
MKQNRPVLIVGAGPTGLTAAIELSRQGVAVRIVDKAPEASRTSRALAVQARTLELLSQRGLTDEMLRRGNAGTSVTFHSQTKQLGKINLESIPSRFNFVLLLAQNETERILSEHLSRQGVHIERSTELIAFSQPENTADGESDRYVTAILRHAGDRLEEVQVAYLISAEGAHSLIRNSLNLEFKGKSLEQAYALADLYVDGDIPENTLSIFVSERGFLGLFPLGKRRFRMIATNPQQHSEDTSDPGLAELQKLYDAETHISATLRDPVWTSRFRINSRMLNTFRARRIFFGGDSAHIHSPAGGQGMNTGIQDMINLGWKLALVYQGQAKPELLETYTEERVPIIKRLVGTTEKATDAVNQMSPIVRSVMTHFAPFVLDLERVQENGARVLSQVNLDYRSSSLSETRDAAGDLHAGDRVPDMNIVCDEPGAAAVPMYSRLDPSSFTLLITNESSAKLPRKEWPSFVKILPVRAAGDPRNKDGFVKIFGTAGGLFVIRPDAYVGFAGRIERHIELSKWFDRHFRK